MTYAYRGNGYTASLTLDPNGISTTIGLLRVCRRTGDVPTLAFARRNLDRLNDLGALSSNDLSAATNALETPAG